MKSEDLLALIRRDLPQQVEWTLQFKAPHDFATNLKMCKEVSTELLKWFDSVIEANPTAPRSEEKPTGATQSMFVKEVGALQSLEDRVRLLEEKLHEVSSHLNRA